MFAARNSQFETKETDLYQERFFFSLHIFLFVLHTKPLLKIYKSLVSFQKKKGSYCTPFIIGLKP